MQLIDVLTDLDTFEDQHLARILMLLFRVEENQSEVDSLTKLAKMDFLLRYPTYLERALRKKGIRPSIVYTRSFERDSVESAMVRYRYGPWDFRYRRFLSILVARGLMIVDTKGNAVKMALTTKGTAIAERFIVAPEYDDIAHRSQLVAKHFDVKGKALMEFIYETFPEILTLTSGTSI